MSIYSFCLLELIFSVEDVTYPVIRHHARQYLVSGMTVMAAVLGEQGEANTGTGPLRVGRV